MLFLHCIPKISTQRALTQNQLSLQKVFFYWPNTYPHYVRYRQTDGQETDDNGTIDAYSK